jgi:DNA-binding MarR family transcriptional regulator
MSSLFRMIHVIYRCGRGFSAARLKNTDLGPNHHRYLFSVCRHPSISEEELARGAYIKNSNVTRHLSYLEEHGYVERKQSAEDKRVLLVYPTEKATDILPRLRKISHDWEDAVMEDFTIEEREQLKSMLERISKNASALYSGESLKEE